MKDLLNSVVEKTLAALLLLLILFVLAVSSATAQNANNYWSPSPLISSAALTGGCLTNGANNSTMTNSALAMTNTFVCSGKELGLQIVIGPQTYSNNQSNLVVLVSKTINGSTWDTLAANTVSLAANLTSVKTVVTNISINSVQAIRLSVYTDAIYGAGITNFQVYATSK